MSAQNQQKQVSFFEFWPAWIMYFPVVVQWILLSLYYRSLTLPFLANPSLKLSGMVGVSKTDLMQQASGDAARVILPWITHRVVTGNPAGQAASCIAAAAEAGIELPFACKPNIGCRGVGVKRVENAAQLEAIIAAYPADAELICQKMASWEPEVGIFYVRHPDTGKIEIPSMTTKYLPKVTGDGKQTLGQLIANDPRAGQLLFLYEARHKDRWNEVLPEGEVFRLVFSASHSKGAVFTDAREDVTPALTARIDQIMQGIPDFYYGRLDVKYRDMESLKKGETLEVVEINGASAESIHIWDKDAKFMEAIRALMWQYRTLFRLGAWHRDHGGTPPTIKQFLDGWLTERRLSRQYPLTD